MPEYPWIIYRMSEGPLTTKEVHQGVNEQLNRKLGTDWGYSEYEWADLLQGFRPLPIRTASGTIAHFSDGADAVPMKSITANITPIQSGTGTPSPSNPRPISGTSALTLNHKGKNLLDYSSTITKEANTVTSTFIADLNFEAGSTYTISATQTPTAGSQTRNTFYLVTPSATTVYGVSDLSIRPMTYTATESGIFKLYLWNHTLDVDVVYSDFQLELGSTATTYEPYNAETYTFDLGQEIMGGTADVVGGVGSKTHEYYDFTNKNTPWDSGAPNEAGFIRFVRAITEKARGYYLLCDKFPTKNGIVPSSPTEEAISGYTSNNSIYIAVSTSRLSGDLTTSAGRRQAFNDWIDANGLEICYELATPTDFTFTGQPINSYLGVNNVWTDSGEVLDVEYRSNF